MDLIVNGARLHYTVDGEGDPIVFAHGLLWSGEMYQFQVASLRARHRCVTFDFRGQGESEVTATGYDMDTLALDAAALIERLGCAPCHFVGLSMGGFVGLRLALRRPDLLRSLTLIESAADGEPRGNVPRYRAMAFVTRLFGVRPLVGRVMRIMFGRTFLADAERRGLRAEMERRLLGNDVTGMRRALEGVITRAPVDEALPLIRTPTLVLSGSEDVAVVPARSRATADKIPNSRFQSIPRAGHTSTIEEPIAVTSALASFFSSLK